MKDTSKISNAHYEIRNAAKTLEVSPHIIHLAKFYVGNDREAVTNWIKENKGKTIEVPIC